MGQPDSPELAQADLDEAKALDRRLTEAIGRKDLDGVMACVWNHPDLVWVLNGVVYRGPDAVRSAVKELLDNHESISLEVNDVTVTQSGNHVVGVGTATYHLKPVDGPGKLLVERWSDVRRKVDGRWVYVLDHTTHLPGEEEEPRSA